MFGFGVNRQEIRLAAQAFAIRGVEDSDTRLEAYLRSIKKLLRAAQTETEGLERAVSNLKEDCPDLFSATVMSTSLLSVRNLFSPKTSKAIHEEVETQLANQFSQGARSWMPAYIIDLWGNAQAAGVHAVDVIASRFLTDLGLDEIDPPLFRFMTGPLFSPILSAAHTDQPMVHFWQMVKNKGRLR